MKFHISNCRNTVLFWACLLRLFVLEPIDSAGQSVINNVQLREVATINGVKGDEFVQVTDIAVLHDQTVLVADRFDYALREFDSMGVFQRKFGRRGKEPGEFKAIPYKLVAINNMLAVAELGANSIKLLGPDLLIAQTIKTAGSIVDLAADEMGRIYTSVIPSSGDKADILISYDISGNLVGKIPLDDAVGEPAFGMLFLCVDADQRLIGAYQSINKIFIRDAAGRMVRRFSVDGLPERAGRNMEYIEKIGSLPEGSIFADVAADRAGHILVLGGDYAPHPKRDVYVLDYAGHTLLTFQLPDQTGLLYVDRQGYLYTREQHRRVVKKYEFHLTKK